MIRYMAASDPGAFFREMLGQWESIANQFGAELMKSGDLARTMQGATSTGLRARDVAREAMSRALEAANMPNRDEILGLNERMAELEERLGRIETLLIKLAGQDPRRSTTSKAARARKSSKRHE